MHAAKVPAAWAADSNLLLLLLLTQMACDLTLAEVHGLMAAVTQSVSENLDSTAQVPECHAPCVLTARVASERAHSSLVPSCLVSLRLAPECADMDKEPTAMVKWVELVLRLMMQRAQVCAKRLRAVQIAVLKLQGLCQWSWPGSIPGGLDCDNGKVCSMGRKAEKPQVSV